MGYNHSTDVFMCIYAHRWIHVSVCVVREVGLLSGAVRFVGCFLVLHSFEGENVAICLDRVFLWLHV